jgi:hypothetical protein
MTEDGKIILQARPSRVPRVPRVPSMQRTSAQAHGKATGTAHCQAPHLCVGPDGSGFHPGVPCCSAVAPCAALLAVAQLSRAVAGWERRTVRGAAGRSVGPVGLSLAVSGLTVHCVARRCAVPWRSGPLIACDVCLSSRAVPALRRAAALTGPCLPTVWLLRCALC